jgi:crotonobetainyl-CoA:carnitine CoA-transferase CaiB-like acyl-CoA transferase
MTGDPGEPTHPAGLSALSGLRVVELGVWVAAPAAGALLADWGADVIKVEPPSGDPMRSAFGSLGGTYVLGWDLSLQEHLGKVAKAEARQANQTPLMNSYRTKDGRWFFFTGLEADRHIDTVCRALGRPDLLADPRFADAGALRKHRTEVIAALDEVVAARTLDEWAERFEDAGVWWAPAQGPADVLEDAQLAANDGFLQLRDVAAGTTRRSVNGPVSFSDLPVRPAAAAPLLGEHTEEVLAELAREREGARAGQA